MFPRTKRRSAIFQPPRPGEEGGKDRGDDRRPEGGVRPVVERPGAKLRAMEAETFEEHGYGVGCASAGSSPRARRSPSRSSSNAGSFIAKRQAFDESPALAARPGRS